MRTFQDECAELAPLETFDAPAFQAGEQVPQELCNFVLTLALIYNDCKNIIYSHILLTESRPAAGEGAASARYTSTRRLPRAAPPFRKTRLVGAWFGVEFHIFRLLLGLLHELFSLIRDNQDLMGHPFWTSVLKQLTPTALDGWQAVVTVASGAVPSDAFGKRLLLVRNKISFHYDPKAIMAGYNRHFWGSESLGVRPFISRGKSMRDTRFYFADAAAIGYLSSIGREQLEEVHKEIVELFGPINHALLVLVDVYIQKRGFVYRAAPE